MRDSVLLVTVVATLMAGCASSGSLERVPYTGFDGDLIALVDTDMPAFAYANGNLLPRLDEPDFVAMVRGGSDPVMIAQVGASNSVTTWPGALSVSPDGRFAYIIEGRQPPSSEASSIESIETGLPPGRTLTVISIENGTLRRVAEVSTAALATGVAVSPDGRTLAVTSEESSSDLQLYALKDGLPVEPLNVDVSSAIGIGDRVGKVEGVAWNPSGSQLAINLGSGGVGFVKVLVGPDNRIDSAVLEPATVTIGKLLSGLRWSLDGRFLYALDTGWGAGRTSRVFNGPGAIHVISYGDGNRPTVIQSVPTGLSSESFTISRDGRLIASVNMERTYLPSGFPTGIVSGRDASSASLFSTDAASGRLTPVGEPVSFRGVLPQGIAFDRGGQNIAVAVFQDHNADSTSGWIQFLAVAGEGTARKLEVTDRRVITPRGIHFLEAMPSGD